MQTPYVIIGIVTVVLFTAVAVVSFAYYGFGGWLCLVYRLKLNKKPIGDV